MSRVGEIAATYFAPSHGLVSTDQGDALKVQLVRDADGSQSISLKAYFYQFGKTDEILAAINSFCAGVMQYGLFLQGRPDNVLVRKKADGICKLVAIDGFRLPHLFPIARWSKY